MQARPDPREVAAALDAHGVDCASSPRRRAGCGLLADEVAELPEPLFALDMDQAGVARYVAAWARADLADRRGCWVLATHRLMAGSLPGDALANVLWWADRLAFFHRDAKGGDAGDGLEAAFAGQQSAIRHIDVTAGGPLAEWAASFSPPRDAASLARAWAAIAPWTLDELVLGQLEGIPPGQREHVARSAARILAAPPGARQAPGHASARGAGDAFGVVHVLAGIEEVSDRERWTRHLLAAGAHSGHPGAALAGMLRALRDTPPTELPGVVRAGQALLRESREPRLDGDIVARLARLARERPRLVPQVVDETLAEVRAGERMVSALEDRAVEAELLALRRAGRTWWDWLPAWSRSKDDGQAKRYRLGVDVHTRDLNARASSSIRALQNLHGDALDVERSVQEVLAFLAASPPRGRYGPRQLRRARAAIVEEGTMQLAYPPVLADPGAFRPTDGGASVSPREMLALIWRTIDTYPVGATLRDLARAGEAGFVARQKEIMREALVTALLRLDTGPTSVGPMVLCCHDGKVKHLIGVVEGFIAGVAMHVELRASESAERHWLLGGPLDELGAGDRHTLLAEESARQVAGRVAADNRAAGTFFHARPAAGNDAPTREEIDALRGACQSVVELWWLPPTDEGDWREERRRREAERRRFEEELVHPYLLMLEEERLDEEAERAAREDT